MQRKKYKRWPYALVILIIIALGGYSAWAIERPQTDLRAVPVDSAMQLQAGASSINWPAQGQSAVGIVGSPILTTNGTQTPVPTASTAKLITALTVLQAKPLAVNQQGPIITLTANDAQLYDKYVAEQGSVVPVAAGEQISEYQMLVAMMLPSANNMADSLAIWAFGSLPAYQSAATVYIQQLGLHNTHIGDDASGFDPSTTSTAHDLTIIGEKVMNNSVLASIVDLPSSSAVPDVGTIKNVNNLLGRYNIIGIKTGNTDQAGGVFVSASRVSIAGKPVTIVTALASAANLYDALANSVPLIQSAQANFQTLVVLKAGTIVSRLAIPGRDSLPIIASQDLISTAWNGSTVPAVVHINSVKVTAKNGQPVGSVTATSPVTGKQQVVPVVLQGDATKPSTWWRLLHP